MFARAFHAVEKVLEILAGTGLFIMMMLTFIDVVGRYGFHHSIFGTAEYVEILMVVTIFSGIAFISAGNEHITVNIFEAWVQRRIPNLQRWAVLAVTVGVYVLITYELFASAFSAMQSGRLTPVLALPQWILPMTAAVLSVFGLVLLLGAILHTRGHLGRMSPDRAAAETMTGVE